jgi:hypothetical protein
MDGRILDQSDGGGAATIVRQRGTVIAPSAARDP